MPASFTLTAPASHEPRPLLLLLPPGAPPSAPAAASSSASTLSLLLLWPLAVEGGSSMPSSLRTDAACRHTTLLQRVCDVRSDVMTSR
jgi:hypothetical protein